MYIYYYSLLNLKQWMRQPEWEETRTQASCYNTGGGGGSLQPANFKGHWVGAGGVIVQGVKCEYLFLSLFLVSFPLFTTWTICKCVVNLPPVKPRAKERNCFCFPQFIIFPFNSFPPFFVLTFPLCQTKMTTLCY